MILLFAVLLYLVIPFLAICARGVVWSVAGLSIYLTPNNRGDLTVRRSIEESSDAVGAIRFETDSIYIAPVGKDYVMFLKMCHFTNFLIMDKWRRILTCMLICGKARNKTLQTSKICFPALNIWWLEFVYDLRMKPFLLVY